MRVTLIGAGPGDPGLLTVKALRRLQEAEVVLYDRLVGEEIRALIPQDAEVINVGKKASHHLLPQEEISRLLIEKALEGKEVVRLKGGDSYVFGRGGEELESLSEHGIPFEVIPGITSSIAAGAYAGIPITHRDYVSSFHVITGHAKAGQALDIDFRALVQTKGTLIFLMSISTIKAICKGCLQGGMPADMPAAIIENATTSKQRKFIGTVGTLVQLAAEQQVVSPAVVIVGKVCALSEKLDFFSQKPLLHKKVIVTRTRSGASGLSEQLRELGCGVFELPAIKTVPMLRGNQALEDALRCMQDYTWLVFTSGAGVNFFFDELMEREYDIRKLHHLKIAAVGSETRKEVMKRGLTVAYTPEEFNGQALAQGLAALAAKGERVLILRARIGARDILDIMREAGLAAEDVAIYDTVWESGRSWEAADMLEAGEVDYVAFASSSAVKGFVQALAHTDMTRIKCVCIGEKTAETARSFGFIVHVSSQTTIAGMAEKIKELVLDQAEQRAGDSISIGKAGS